MILDIRESSIFVAGHNGLVGSAIVRKLRTTGHQQLILRTSAELDLREQRAVSDFFARERPEYVFVFENRGVEVGVTLHHPHGQIYAYPFVPPIPARELAAEREYYEAHGRGLLEAILEEEVRDGRRLLHQNRGAIAFMPAFARYAYEVWIATARPCPSLAAMDEVARAGLARALKSTLLRFDGLWHRPFPYVMVFHQAPTDGRTHPEAHLHIEFYPAYRMQGRLKYLAGSELGAGVFTSDTVPEDKAAELRAIDVSDAMR